MLVSASRTVSVLTMRALVYGGLFVVVVILHLAVTGALRSVGLPPGLSLFVSGAAVLGLVLVLVNMLEWLREREASRQQMLRMRQRLPAGPCCVVWRARDEISGDSAMPWELAGPLRARYPRLARRLGVEGIAIAEFEVNAQGRAKNIHCVDAWPSDVFYEAAREALEHAQFAPRPDIPVRFGASYRIPFVFRIAGAARLRDRGRHAQKLRPELAAAARAVARMRRTA